MAKSMKIRAKSQGGVADIKVLITHPMEPGNRKDKKTGKMIEPHFIQEISFQVNGKDAVSGMMSGAVSKNPYINVKTAANPGDKLTVAWTDNKGNKGSGEADVK